MAEGQVGLCCRVAELSDKCGNELLNLIEADAYRLGKQVQQFISPSRCKRWTRN